MRYNHQSDVECIKIRSLTTTRASLQRRLSARKRTDNAIADRRCHHYNMMAHKTR